MPILKTEFECPTCRDTTGETNQILANAGELSCSKNGMHKWNDTGSFLALQPKMVFKVGPAKFPPVEGQEPITLKVPITLKNTLTEKYGDGLSTTVATVLLALSSGDVMMVSAEDLKRISDKLGKMPKDSAELYGIIFAKMCEADDARNEAKAAIEDLKAYESRSEGRVVLDLGDQYTTAQVKAKDAEMPLKLWLEQQVHNAIKENWF